MIYAILAYKHSLQSITKLIPMDIVNGRISSNDSFNHELDRVLLKDYFNQHKQKANIMNQKIISNLVENKEHLVWKLIETSDEPEIFRANHKTYIKNNIRQNQADTFQKPFELENVNSMRKVVSTDKQEKTHYRNLTALNKNKTW